MSETTEIVVKSNEINKPYEVEIGDTIEITRNGKPIESFTVKKQPGIEKSILDVSMCVRQYLYAENVPDEDMKAFICDKTQKIEQFNLTDIGATDTPIKQSHIEP